jgi:hypothetical protein
VVPANASDSHPPKKNNLWKLLARQPPVIGPSPDPMGLCLQLCNESQCLAGALVTQSQEKRKRESSPTRESSRPRPRQAGPPTLTLHPPLTQIAYDRVPSGFLLGRFSPGGGTIISLQLQVCICRSFCKKLLVAYLEYIILLHASKYQGFWSTMSGKQPTKSTRFGMSSAGTHARSKRT